MSNLVKVDERNIMHMDGYYYVPLIKFMRDKKHNFTKENQKHKDFKVTYYQEAGSDDTVIRIEKK